MNLPPPHRTFGRSTPSPIPSTPAPTAAPGLSAEEIARWREDLNARLARVHQHPESGLGFIEETVRQAALELQCQAVQKALQAKADIAGECCPDCQTPLRDKKRRVPRTLRAFCGPVRFHRTHGWCPRCEEWVFPADVLLGLRADSAASPLVQETSALLVSKMPAEQAEALSRRVLGIGLSRSTLAREAQRQGERAIQQRDQSPGSPPVAKPAAGGDALPPVDTMVIQIDALSIRERDDWGETQSLRKKGLEPERWHWVYAGTCYQLSHCLRKGKKRALITQRQYAVTRQGVQALIRQLHAQAMRAGLARAKRVLVIADGAVWIWKAVSQRFPEAVQRLDLYHANAYLWAVANALHADDPAAARRWVKPLLRQVRDDKVVKVIASLKALLPTLDQLAAKKTVKQTIGYYRRHKKRMTYKAGEKRKEPLGSGAIESTCRQIQCRMKRCGQFWSTTGDEALLALEVFWRNDCWEHLFPHARIASVAAN